MISAKKILEGCLLAVANDCSEKWKMYLDGTEFTEDEEQRFPKDVYNYLDYNQHLVPLYKLSGQLCVNLRSGVSSASALAKRKEVSTVMDDFPGLPQNASFFTSSLVTRAFYDSLASTPPTMPPSNNETPFDRTPYRSYPFSSSTFSSCFSPNSKQRNN